MTDWLFHCLVLTTHKGVPNLFFHFKSSSKMTIIMLLRTFKFAWYMCGYIFMSFQDGGIRNSTEQRVGVLKKARVNEGNI